MKIFLKERAEELVRIYFEKANTAEIRAVLPQKAKTVEEAFWGNGIATEAVAIFLQEISEKFQIETVGAFTFLDNVASIRVLEKNGFERKEVFEEAGRISAYFQKE